MIVCSIDLMGGKAVQLERGERLVLERYDVVALAGRFGRLGEVAVIDLDAALGRGDNRPLIEAVTRAVGVPVVASGGASNAESFVAGLTAGADAVLGASSFHSGALTVREVKQRCVEAGLTVRA